MFEQRVENNEAFGIGAVVITGRLAVQFALGQGIHDKEQRSLAFKDQYNGVDCSEISKTGKGK